MLTSKPRYPTPTISAPSSIWISLYLYPFESSTTTVLTEVLTLFLDMPADNSGGTLPMFYIFYADSIGSHVRVRFNVADGIDSVAHTAQHVHSILGLAEYSVCGPSVRWSSACKHLRFVRHVHYRPEVQRYGGRALIPISESLFVQSSKWALLHAYQDSSYNKRLPLAAICTHILFLVVFTKSELYDTYRTMLATRLIPFSSDKDNETYQVLTKTADANFEALSACFHLANRIAATIHPAANTALSEWLTICVAHSARLRALAPNLHARRKQRIVGSWAHMHNNRLGIRPVDEALIAYSFLHQSDST